MICTFFGHRDCSENVREKLREAIVGLIENDSVDTFYVGEQGNFDRLVYAELKELKKRYPTIKYRIILAYHPRTRQEGSAEECDTLFPEIPENVLPRYAIDKRNRWMIEKSDYVITYVRHVTGGAAKYRDAAVKKGKIVIDI